MICYSEENSKISNVAVLMSTYNGEKYLQEQIDSILAQTGNFNLSLIVRDDGSNDRTQIILEEYAKEDKIKWYSSPNLGPALSFLDLIKNNPGYDYYAFSDQDDYWLPEKLSKAIEILENKTGIQLYFSNAELVDSKLQSLGRNVYKKSPKLDFETLTCAGGILGCTMVFNNNLAKIIQEKKLPHGIVMHDFYLSNLCIAVGGTITCDLRTYMKYRQHTSNVIGVPSGKVNIVKNRIKDILKKSQYGIDNQSIAMLDLYSDVIPISKVIWLRRIACYNKNFISRVKLALSPQTVYVNRNMGLKNRISILLGNR